MTADIMGWYCRNAGLLRDATFMPRRSWPARPVGAPHLTVRRVNLTGHPLFPEYAWTVTFSKNLGATTGFFDSFEDAVKALGKYKAYHYWQVRKRKSR